MPTCATFLSTTATDRVEPDVDFRAHKAARDLEALATGCNQRVDGGQAACCGAHGQMAHLGGKKVQQTGQGRKEMVCVLFACVVCVLCCVVCEKGELAIGTIDTMPCSLLLMVWTVCDSCGLSVLEAETHINLLAEIVPSFARKFLRDNRTPYLKVTTGIPLSKVCSKARQGIVEREGEGETKRERERDGDRETERDRDRERDGDRERERQR